MDTSGLVVECLDDADLTPAMRRMFHSYMEDWYQAYGLILRQEPVPADLAGRVLDVPVQAVMAAAFAVARQTPLT